MQIFLETLLRCSVYMSIISLMYMIAMSLLSKRYSAKWLYCIWLVILIGWAIPFRPHFDMNLIPFQMPKIQGDIQEKYIGVAEPIKIIANGINKNSFVSLWFVIAIIWVIGMIGLIAYNVYRHWYFLKMVNRWSEEITKQGMLNVLNNLRIEMKIKSHVMLKTCPVIASPMIIGFFNPIILLPSTETATDELTFILRHELIHLKRNDLWYKVLVLLVTAVHWFNPVVYIMAKAIAVQCEISCDELLVQETSFEHRKQYSEILIGVARNGTKFQTALSTGFYTGGKVIKARIFNIMDATKKKTGITILCVVFILIIGSKITFASDLTKNENCLITDSKMELTDTIGNKQVINVDVKNLESGKVACIGGSYILEEDDVISYDITTEGDKDNFSVKLLRENNETSGAKKYYQELTLENDGLKNSDNQCKVTKSQAGRYCLIICSNDEENLSNIKGTIEIIKGI